MDPRIQTLLKARSLDADRLKGSFPERPAHMLASPGGRPFDDARFLYEIKYDGARAFAAKDGAPTRLISRGGHLLGNSFPEIGQQLDEIPAQSFLVDGEIICPDQTGRPRFSLLQTRLYVADPGEARRRSRTAPAVFYVFDLLYLDGLRLESLPLELRKEMLSRFLPQGGRLVFAPHLVESGVAMFEAATRLGLEGIVAKRADSVYVFGKRTKDWVKIKAMASAELVIGGFTPPEGRRDYFGALLLGAYASDGQLEYVGRVGTGFDERTLEELWEHMRPLVAAGSPFRRRPPVPATFLRPELVCEVAFSELTPDGILRNPSYKGLRPNRSPSECRLEQMKAELARPPWGGEGVELR